MLTRELTKTDGLIGTSLDDDNYGNESLRISGLQDFVLENAGTWSYLWMVDIMLKLKHPFLFFLFIYYILQKAT